MANPTVFRVDHALLVAEVRRRLDTRTPWMLERLAGSGIQVALSDWADNARTFEASALGRRVTGRLAVAADHLRCEAMLPLALRLLAPMAEPIARRYGERLLAPE